MEFIVYKERVLRTSVKAFCIAICGQTLLVLPLINVALSLIQCMNIRDALMS